MGSMRGLVLPLLLLLVHGAVAALQVLPPEPQASYTFKLPAAQNASNDLPLDEAPLARNVTGFEPEGINLALWGPTSVLVSWSTGEPLIGPNTDPPEPYDPYMVRSVVRLRWSAAGKELTAEAEQDHRLVYQYVYGEKEGNTTYQSPILHHVLLRDLQPGVEHFYSVGDEGHGWSEELSFKLPGGYPIKVGVMGDLGQTANSTVTVAGLVDAEPDVLISLGDNSYANDHKSNDAGDDKTSSGDLTSYQPRWDAWARMMQQLQARVPFVGTGGNHEIEMLLTSSNATFTSINARYPMPNQPESEVLQTAPNYGIDYLDYINVTQTAPVRFKNESEYVPQSGYFSVDVPGVHIVSLHSYLPWGKESRQYRWLERDLAAVDRAATPFVVVGFHAAIYHSYVEQYKQADTFRDVMEPLLVRHGVDLVLAGHVHSYERTYPMVNWTRNDCGPMHITIGDGGNIEGLSLKFIDEQPQQAYCANTSLYTLPGTQPIDRLKPVISLQDGKFCPTSQPAWSAFREASFGFGLLEVLNATHATWEWKRDAGLGSGQVDRVMVVRREDDGTCAPKAPASAPTVSPASGAARWAALPGWLLLAGLFALPAMWLAGK